MKAPFLSFVAQMRDVGSLILRAIIALLIWTLGVGCLSIYWILVVLRRKLKKE